MAIGVRFAPSPTGDFHVGNLRTAWISYVWARAMGEPWILRFDDIDRARVVPGARESQLRDMGKLGLVPYAESLQSAQEERHWQVFAAARAEGKLYPCFCSRKEVQDSLAGLASAPHASPPLYDGHCRAEKKLRADHPHPTIAWRFLSEQDPDGKRDFIVARTDPKGERESFQSAYAWATAIDDFDGDFALLVRARDLAAALADQREVQVWLREREGRGARALPAVFHTSLVTLDDGARLEKRTRGVRLAELLARGFAVENILAAFEKSFAAESSDFAPAKVWGEARAQISLTQLGLTHAGV